MIPGFKIPPIPPHLLTATTTTPNERSENKPGHIEILDPPVLPIYFEKITHVGKKLTVLHDNLGFTYSNHYTTCGDGLSPQKVVWRCSQKYKQCKASCVVENNKIVLRKNFHNHSAS